MSRASQGLAPSLNSMQGPAQLPSASIAQSGVAQLDMSSLGIAQSPRSGQGYRRPPPGFAARSGDSDVGSSPAFASGSGNPNASPQTQSSQHALHHEAAENALMQRFVAARDHAADSQYQQAPIRVTQDGDARGSAAQHRQAAPVPHHIQSQQEKGAPVPSHIQSLRERGAPVPPHFQSQRERGAPVPPHIQSQRERGAPVPSYIQSQRERRAPVPSYIQNQGEQAAPVPHYISMNQQVSMATGRSLVASKLDQKSFKVAILEYIAT